MSRPSSGNGLESLFFGWVMLLVVSSVLMTLVGGIWIHWLAFIPALLVGGWTVQAMGR